MLGMLKKLCFLFIPKMQKMKFQLQILTHHLHKAMRFFDSSELL